MQTPIVNVAVGNLDKIMRDRGLTKSKFAELIGFPESKWNKISNGNQGLTVDELSIIASKLGIREIDIYTYPEKYYKPQDNNEEEKLVSLTVQVPKEVRDKVVQLVFNNKTVNITNN